MTTKTKIKEPEHIELTIPVETSFPHLMFHLAALGITHISVTYYGSNKCGEISDVHLHSTGDVLEDGKETNILRYRDDWPTGDENTRKVSKVLKERIIDYCRDDILDTELQGWTREAGSQGTIFISTADNKYYCNHEVNFHDSYFENYNGVLKED